MRNRSEKWLSLILVFSLVIGLIGSIYNPIIASPIIEAVDLTGTSYTQNFDTLANSGSPAWSNDSTLTGWYLITDTNSSVTSYSPGTGTETTGAFYSYGSSGATERALGGLGSNSYYGSSGSGKGHIGLVIYNNTGKNISQILISYVGEQWRANNASAQSLTFTYKNLTTAPMDASVFASATTGWTAVSGLTFSSPINTTSSPQAKDGNLAENRLSISSSISGISMSPGTYILLRWTDLNDSGNDHGLAIDDLSLTFTTTDVDTAPAVTSTTPANLATDIALDSNISITFNEAVDVIGSWFSISCGTSLTHTAAVSGGPTSYILNPDSDFVNSETCTVTVTAANVTDQDTNEPPDAMAADHVFSFTTAAPVIIPLDVVINEFSASTTGTDVEYVEIYGTPSSSFSAYKILEIEGDSGSPIGMIDEVISLGSTDANGFHLVNLAANALENGSLSLLLVKDFTGAFGNDLDTDNDGTLDLTPWSAIVDAVAVNDGSAGDITYGAPILAVMYDGLPYAPGGASRIPDGTDTDTAADWMRNDFDLYGIPGQTGTPIVGEAINTPGAPNLAYTPPPAAFINEVDSDTPGTDAAEFVELFDGGAGNTALDGMVVVFFNGSNDLSYAAFDLDGYSTNANGFFVLGNTALSPDITFSDGLLQNGADAVALYQANATDFPTGTAVTTSNLLDAMVYDTSDADDAGLLALLNPLQPQVDENASSASATVSNQRCPNGSGGARITSTYAQWTPTPGSLNVCAASLTCGAPSTPIHDVQGNGATSPLVSSVVEVEGIVAGDFQNNTSSDEGDLNGFHLQAAEGNYDADPSTSEGVFIYAPGAINVSTGDGVRVRGTVSEYNGMTEITALQVQPCSTGNIITPASLGLPVISLNVLEAHEGMLVTFAQPLAISEYFNFDQYGEIVLTSMRHLTPTALVEPGAPAIALSAAYLLDNITLDDGRTAQNPDPALHPDGTIFDMTNLFRGGDLLVNVTGVLDYSFDKYRIQPTQGATHLEVNPRPLTPPDVGGSMRVVSMNVLNYFVTLNSRGANTAEEFTRQRDKTIAAILAMNSDIAGLVEIENHPTDAALANLVAGLNAVAGAGTYDYIHTGVIGGDEIKVALIYKPATVSPMGAYAILDSSVDARFIDTLNRPVLAQTFMSSATGGVFTVAVNHLKSKGSECTGDPDLGDGQGNCNLTRLAAAQAEVDWLASDPTGSNDTDFMIIGDLNSYDKEEPIDALLAGADDTPGTADDFVDMLFSYQGESAYSYVFDGQIGYLDYAASNSLAAQISGVDTWHVNADEPDLIDYDMTYKKDAQDLLYAPDFYRYADHDPILIGLNLLKAAGAKTQQAAKQAADAGGEDESETPTALPDTGFAPGRITALPQQAVAYSELGDLWLEIPALGVKTAITGVPVSNSGWDVTWLGDKAGWLEGSAFPGTSGNAVLTGHVWDALNRPGVFEKLANLRYGDQVMVHNAGKVFIFEVRERLQVSADRVNQLLKHKERPWLTLLTCRGFDEESGEYLSRVLVRAVLVEVK